MKKKYVAPIVEKITFDYKVQTAATECFGSVVNVLGADGVTCVSGTPVPIGWNNPQTVV